MSAGFLIGCLLAVYWIGLLCTLLVRKTNRDWAEERERQAREIERTRRLCRHRLAEGFSPEQVGRELHLPLVIVSNEKRMMEGN